MRRLVWRTKLKTYQNRQHWHQQIFRLNRIQEWIEVEQGEKEEKGREAKVKEAGQEVKVKEVGQEVKVMEVGQGEKVKEVGQEVKVMEVGEITLVPIQGKRNLCSSRIH